MEIKFTMPLDEEIALKMTYISKYYGRSRIKEIEWAWTEQGKISMEDLKEL